jgi:hypothetical protein
MVKKVRYFVFFVLVIARLLASTQANAGVYYSVETSIQGGQTGINAAATSSWSFAVGSAWSFGGGTFTMKSGSSATLPITLSVYSGANFGTLVASLSLTNTAFCAQLGGGCQSFGAVQFLFPTPLVLAAQTTYYIDLASQAGTAGSQQYFIKGASSTLSFVDSNNNPIPAQDLINTSNTVPEPATIGVVASALLTSLVARRCTRRRLTGRKVR